MVDLMTDVTPQYRPPRALDAIYYALSLGFLGVMLYYYWTGLGGPTLLAMTMIPAVYVLFVLQALRQNDLYPQLPLWLNYLIAALVLHEYELRRAR
jgi:hypothetical protein